jgi:hypothetical protein
MKWKKVAARLVLYLFVANISFAGDAWVIRDDGAGPAKIGMSLAQLVVALHQDLSMPAEKDVQGCFYVNPRGHEHIAFMIVDKRLVRLDVYGPGIATSTGIQVGDSESRVRKVYGSRVKLTPHTYVDNGHYLTIRSEDPRFGVRFETNDGKITMFYAGTFEAIQYVEGCE